MKTHTKENQCCEFALGDKVIITNTRTPKVKENTEAIVIEIKKLVRAFGFDDNDRYELKLENKDGIVGWYYPSDIKKKENQSPKIFECNEVKPLTTSEDNTPKTQKIQSLKDKKVILDICCGGRCFWFDKHNPAALYCDIREDLAGFSPERPNFEVRPDRIMDFRKLELPDKSFKLIVFDPPHLLAKKCGNGIMKRKYGALGETWKEDLKQGWLECWRVLEDYGVLVFKWNEISVSIKEVLLLFPISPLFGHPTAKHGKTKWFVFMKIPEDKI
jgi:hypothetical protein